ncbi:winged helix-turn-helix transcriptional regulator [Proteiniborus sp. MB09-C3]|uniref:winged helix-turn-helix transcriptional regulator n=1 Tax=Proteiniborus sp. MB09-C3 TaxID=3050072 RepID=UPI0025572AAF|nr:winged helix-turn-helix transcriptional regulator [Proteiniborus sp. MB09-C3]WIV13747.1 winged helix-turn-helix transcriptional regulator [Proteiniborus sp. MB09-C3]
MKNQYNLPCNIAQTLNIIGDKWTLLILRQLSNGYDTYNSILENLEGIPSNLLSNRLKSLEEDGLIIPVLYQSHPPRYRYVLTESGKDLDNVFYSIILWGERHLNKCYKELVHSSCNHKINIQYYCPHCNEAIDKREITVKNGEDYPH